jgi:probable phosphoglycerate mutase
VDADPASFPGGSHWLSTYGLYENGTRGKPLLVSLLVYLDQEWWPEWDAETLFCDADTGVGLLVQPQPARCVLMHQDVLHRISTPSLSAHRPRYSLVWKLVFVPRTTSAPGEVGNLGADLGAASLAMERLGDTLRVAQHDVPLASKPAGGLDAVDRETICRPEWGEPVRIGRPARTRSVK